MRWHNSQCACGRTVWWKMVQGEMRPYESDAFGQHTRRHLCFTAPGAEESEPGHEALYRACPYLRPGEDS